MPISRERWISDAGQRLALLALLPGMGGGVLTSACAVLLVRALVPAATAIATTRAVTELTSSGGLVAAVLPVAVVLLVGEACEHSLEPLQYLASRRIDGAHRRAVAAVASAPPGIEHLESAEYQNDLRRAASDPDNWTEGTPGAAAWAQLTLLFAYLGALLAAAVIARDLPWLAATLLVVLLAGRAVQRRELMRPVRAWAAGLGQRRRAEYWTSVLTEPATAKEVRILGLSDWAGRQHRTHTEAHLQPFRSAKDAKLRRQWSWLFVLIAAMSAGLYVLGDAAVRGDLPVARLAGDLAALAAMLAIAVVNPGMIALEAGLPPLQALQRLRRWPRTGTGAAPAAAQPGPGQPTIRFEGVRFTYPGAARPTLNGLDLEIRPGEVLALVGLNGAGKTTVIKLLTGLYQPDRGRITVDGADLRDLDLPGWRRQVAVVFQDFIRHQLTVTDNVTLGPPDRPVDLAALRAALAEAGIDELVAGLPLGIDTPLSPGRTDGTDLSGGQWQRVALARALYAKHRRARVLVLDEPTANLDIRTEFEVFGQLTRAAADASVVLISHRLSTVREADRIVLVADGVIQESGTHDELMSFGGAYAAMFLAQAQRVLGEADEVVG